MVAIRSENKARLTNIAALVFPGEELVHALQLGGLTNYTYAVSLPSGTYVFRLPGKGTDELINRKDEKTSTELASKLGIDAELIYFDASTGVKVSAYIEQAVTQSPESMREQHNIINAANTFRILHNSDVDTGVPFEVFDMVMRYEKIITSNTVELYEDYPQIRNAVMAIKEKMDALAIKKAPCHNDPLCENWVSSFHRMYLVDWEYAGMNDPLWDLADISIEADYTPAMDDLLLQTYCGTELNDAVHFRFFANKIYLDFLWSLWGKTRVPYDGETMETYALNRYRRLKTNLAASASML